MADHDIEVVRGALRSYHTAAGHRFDERAQCLGCGVTWMEHQVTPAPCPKASEPEPELEEPGPLASDAREPARAKRPGTAAKLELARALGRRIVAARERCGLRQADLIRRLGVECIQATLCQWENGHALPNALWLVRLAGALNVTTDWLLGIERQGGDPC